MLSIQQHKVMNAKYLEETSECAVVQISEDDVHWQDYSRTDIDSAVRFIQTASPTKYWRVRDWITAEVINTSSDITPEAITAELNASNPWNQRFPNNWSLRQKLTAAQGAAMGGLQALEQEHEGDLRASVESLVRLANEISDFVKGM